MPVWDEFVEVRLQLAVGVYEPGGTVGGVWDVSLWDDPAALWGLDDEGGAGAVAWEDIQCDIIDLRVNRGKASWQAQFGPGTMSARLANVYGDYTPQVPSPNQRIPLRIGRRIRVQVREPGGVWVSQFTGTIRQVSERLESDWANEVRVRAVDPFAYLQAFNLTAQDAPTGDGWTGDQRVAFILDEVGWPSALRDLQAGITPLQASTFPGNVLEELRMVEASTGGSVFADRDGRVVFRNRDWLTSHTSTPVKFGGDGHCIDQLAYDYSLERVVNRVRLSSRSQAPDIGRTVPDEWTWTWRSPVTSNRGDIGLAGVTGGRGSLQYSAISNEGTTVGVRPFMEALEWGMKLRVVKVDPNGNEGGVVFTVWDPPDHQYNTPVSAFGRFSVEGFGESFGSGLAAGDTVRLEWDYGVTVTVDDTVSVAQHGPQTYTRNDLQTKHPDDLQWLADRLLANLKDSRQRVTGLEVTAAPDTDVPLVAGLDYGDRVDVEYGHRLGWGFTAAAQVVGTGLTVTQDRVTWQLNTDDAEVTAGFTDRPDIRMTPTALEV